MATGSRQNTCGWHGIIQVAPCTCSHSQCYCKARQGKARSQSPHNTRSQMLSNIDKSPGCCEHVDRNATSEDATNARNASSQCYLSRTNPWTEQHPTTTQTTSGSPRAPPCPAMYLCCLPGQLALPAKGIRDPVDILSYVSITPIA